MSDLLQISETLGELYRSRAILNLLIQQTEEDIKMRKVDLTPVEGWPGKNAEQREIEAARVFADDQAMRAISGTLDDLKHEIVENTGAIEALEADRRGLEWQIRADLVQALAGKHDNSDEFDDALEGATDQALDAQFSDVPF